MRTDFPELSSLRNAWDVTVTEDDCGTRESLLISEEESRSMRLPVFIQEEAHSQEEASLRMEHIMR